MYEDLLKKMLEVHRIQRHDFMNHLQVVSGYLQLGNLEKAQNYSLKAVKSLRSYEQLSKIPLPFLQSFLTWFVVRFNITDDVFEFIFKGDWQEWEDVDEELTRILMELFSFVQDNLINNDLKCRLNFLDDSLGFSLLFVGKEDCINRLKKQKFTSLLLSVSCEEITQGKLAVIIKR